jgi:AcrR family transcriptional regulator
VGDDAVVESPPDDDAAPGPDAWLPETVAKAWGLREPRGKGPRPSLSLARIVDAAVALAREEGLAAVSMARVAAKLGVSTMALYRYVSDKNELLTLMVDNAWGGPPRPSDAATDWRSGLTVWARALHAAGVRDPWVVEIPISSAPATPHQVAWMDACFAALDGTGLRPGECASVLLLLSGYVRNQVALTASLMAALTTHPEAARLMGSYSEILARVADPARFPALAAAVAAGAFDDPEGEAGDEGLDAEFVFGLERILDGVETLIRSRG